MTAEFIWGWFVVPTLAALMIAAIGIAGRHMILGDMKHPVLRLGVAVAVVVVLAIGSGVVFDQFTPLGPRVPVQAVTPG